MFPVLAYAAVGVDLSASGPVDDSRVVDDRGDVVTERIVDHVKLARECAERLGIGRARELCLELVELRGVRTCGRCLEIGHVLLRDVEGGSPARPES